MEKNYPDIYKKYFCPQTNHTTTLNVEYDNSITFENLLKSVGKNKYIIKNRTLTAEMIVKINM